MSDGVFSLGDGRQLYAYTTGYAAVAQKGKYKNTADMRTWTMTENDEDPEEEEEEEAGGGGGGESCGDTIQDVFEYLNKVRQNPSMLIPLIEVSDALEGKSLKCLRYQYLNC